MDRVLSPHPPGVLGTDEQSPYKENVTDIEGSSNTISITFTVADRVGVLKEILEIFEKKGISLSLLESRPGAILGTYDFFVQFCEINSTVVAEVTTALEILPTCTHILALNAKEGVVPWYPQKISDLDKFTHKVLAYGEELDADHPGFHDVEYRKRRQEITQIARDYKYGTPIPRVEYTESEIDTWRQVYLKLKELYPTHACKQFLHIFPLLEENCGYSPDSIPQIEDVSRFLKECTGWTLRPVSGLLSSRDFLNGLAFRVFHSTQYIRHHSRPFYTPEPDCCHELLGHVPLFADPEFASFSQEIGLASLGAADEDLDKLATCYWFTVEFGLCKQRGLNGDEEVKAFGAGLLSSFGELAYSLSHEPSLLPFSPALAASTPYPVTKYQPTYFVAESFETAKKQLQEYCQTFVRPFELYYNPVTQCVEKLDSVEKIARVAKGLQQQLALVSSALSRFASY
mmetsp:Transcript_135737/g.201866  ORF Transcript_135737/g.201866 Transcript_135737/m.201866 type:complete len:458 (-) Transcript_135737:45-1418(-)